MACFVAPMSGAIVCTVVQKVVRKRSKNGGGRVAKKSGFSWGQRLSWLNKMLWGGSILLAFEHLWHGEIVPWPPFLTAMKNPSDVAPMLHEIATVGTTMAVTVTVVWALMVLVVELRVRSAATSRATADVGGAE